MNPAAIAWVILVLVINAYWIIYDFAIAKPLGWKTMTTQFQDWLHAPVAGPIVFGVMMFVIGAFCWHMLVKAAS